MKQKCEISHSLWLGITTRNERGEANTAVYHVRSFFCSSIIDLHKTPSLWVS